MAAFHVTDDSYSKVIGHLAAFRYLRGLSRELKIPVGKPDFQRLMEPIQTTVDSDTSVTALVVYLDKVRYTGPYLNPSGSRGSDAHAFRNFVLRCLLEHHLTKFDLSSSHWDLVLDRVEMSVRQQMDLRSYLSGNQRIPNSVDITHASSIYVDGLQVVHHITNGFADILGGEQVSPFLKFVSSLDITLEQRVPRSSTST